uniref:Uncharacterized protein n=1 Tax=Arundo donax TaxID=35708 RepID=A0A0A9AY72_ARUDO
MIIVMILLAVYPNESICVVFLALYFVHIVS